MPAVGDAALAKRLETFLANMHVQFVPALAKLRPHLGAEARRIAGGWAAFTGVDSPMTQAVGVAIGEPIDDFDELEAFFRERGAACLIHATPWTHESLFREVAARGYVVAEWENVFVRSLSGEAPRERKIRVEQIGEDRIDLWARVGAEGFSTEGASPQVLIEIFTPFPHADGVRAYIAYVDDQPAGSAACFVDGEIVGLFGAATLPQFRGRGVQTALLERRLFDAASDGAKEATVMTVPGSASHRNVARRGFELAYTKANFKRTFAVGSKSSCPVF